MFSVNCHVIVNIFSCDVRFVYIFTRVFVFCFFLFLSLWAEPKCPRPMSRTLAQPLGPNCLLKPNPHTATCLRPYRAQFLCKAQAPSDLLRPTANKHVPSPNSLQLGRPLAKPTPPPGTRGYLDPLGQPLSPSPS